MNPFNSVLSKPLLAFGLSLSLFACGGDKPAEPTQTTESPAATQEAPKSGDAIVVAVTQDFAPFTYLDESGKIVGFDIDVINAIANKKGLNVQFKATSFDNIFTDVQNKAVDMGASGIFYKEERASKYGLTKPYHTDRPVYFYRADNEKLAKANLSSMSDLNNYSLNIAVVGSVEGLSSNHNISAVKSEFVGFTGVLQNKYDVAFSDESVLRYAIKNNPESAKVALKTVAYEGDVGYVMMVNKENTALLETLNAGIDELIQSGEINQIKQQYGFDQ